MRFAILAAAIIVALAGCEVDEWGNDIQNPAHAVALRSVSASAPRVGLPPAGAIVSKHFVNSWVEDTSFPQTMDKVDAFGFELCRSSTGCNPRGMESAMTCRDVSADAILCQFRDGGAKTDFTLYANQLMTLQNDRSMSSNAGVFRSGVWHYDDRSKQRARDLYDQLYRVYSDTRTQNLQTAVRNQQRQIDQTTAFLNTVGAVGTAVTTGQSSGAATAPRPTSTTGTGGAVRLPIVRADNCVSVSQERRLGGAWFTMRNVCDRAIFVLFCDATSSRCPANPLAEYRARTNGATYSTAILDPRESTDPQPYGQLRRQAIQLFVFSDSPPGYCRVRSNGRC